MTALLPLASCISGMTVLYLSWRNRQRHRPLQNLLGWGLLTIWRLDESFGLRQLTSLIFSMAAFIAIITRAPHNLSFLRQYKYVLLTGGLLLTALTLIAGTNPLGVGPRLWLGCCGVYFQPSEPLKLLLVIYLAAYLADRHPLRLTAIPLLLPTTVLTGLALMLLTTPILLPIVTDLGFSPIWFGIFLVRTMEIGFVHPPIGINLYVIQNIAPDIPLTRVFKGVLPFLAADFVHLALLIAKFGPL